MKMKLINNNGKINKGKKHNEYEIKSLRKT
jgi:hypothetical protein